MSLYWAKAVAADTTSSVFYSPQFEASKIHVMSDGDASAVVAIQFANPEGTYRSFPDTELTGEGAKEVIIPRNTSWKVSITSATTANVEVKLV